MSDARDRPSKFLISKNQIMGGKDFEYDDEAME